MHADAVEGGRQVLGDARSSEQREQVVGVEDGDLRRLSQPLGAERADVGVRAHEDAVVALEAAQLADRLRDVVLEVERAVVALDDLRARQVRRDPLAHRDRAGAGAAAAVRLGERLVQVEVHDVEAHVARAGDAHDRVEVGAVVVERRPDLVHDPRDLLDLRVEDAERVRVRQHQAGDRVVGLGAQVVDVDAAVGVRADLDDLVAGHRHRRRVGAVRGVGRQHLRAVLAAVLVVGARQQQAGELAVGAGARLERDVRHAGDLAERLLQAVHQLERALRPRRILQRVQAGVAGQAGDPLVQLRVVLHRARPERIEAGVEIEVALRQAVVVAHDLRLGDLRQLRRLGAPQRGRDQLVERLDRHVERRRGEGAAALDRALVDRLDLVALHRQPLDGLGRDGAAHALAPAPAVTVARSATSARSSASARRSICARERCSVIAISSPFSYSG